MENWSDSTRTAVERECLQEATLTLGDTATLPQRWQQRIREILLEGEYPDTAIVIHGERTVDRKRWTVRHRIWANNGGTINGEPNPRFIGAMIQAAVLEA